VFFLFTLIKIKSSNNYHGGRIVKQQELNILIMKKTYILFLHSYCGYGWCFFSPTIDVCTFSWLVKKHQVHAKYCGNGFQ